MVDYNIDRPCMCSCMHAVNTILHTFEVLLFVGHHAVTVGIFPLISMHGFRILQDIILHGQGIM